MTEVVVRGGRGLSQQIEAGGHQIVADEPVSAGGQDLGPNPYELLLAALGSCSAMTVRLYADRKGWPLEGLEIRLSHTRIHADDCRDCETRSGWLDQISKRVALRGPLDEAQRQRLAEIAERCPVQVSLTRETVVRQELAPADGAPRD